MKRKIDITDFTFRPVGFGIYQVIYESPVTGRRWTTIVDDMTIIDATRNADTPKIKDLEMLKRICKR